MTAQSFVQSSARQKNVVAVRGAPAFFPDKVSVAGAREEGVGGRGAVRSCLTVGHACRMPPSNSCTALRPATLSDVLLE